jgi:predicted helicase
MQLEKSAGEFRGKVEGKEKGSLHLGTRSALEWLVDQYRYEEDAHSGTASDPNDPDDKKFIVRLVERVTTVSLKTIEAIKGLPEEMSFVGFRTK